MFEPRGQHVEFVDGDGQIHAVVLAHHPWLLPRWRAHRKLRKWKRQGRAFYAEPLEFVQTRRR